MAATPALQNSQIWGLSAFYLTVMVVFAFLQTGMIFPHRPCSATLTYEAGANVVLSVIFVVEPIISEKGYLKAVHIPLSIDIPEYYNGRVVRNQSRQSYRRTAAVTSPVLTCFSL